jgi:hypothetical protein
MKLTVLRLFAARTAGAQSTTQQLPVMDAEKIADALRAGPQCRTIGPPTWDTERPGSDAASSRISDLERISIRQNRDELG